MTDPITMTDPLTSPTSFDADSTAEDVTAGLDLSGKTILLTGCNSGIGEETLRVLGLRGAEVIGLARTIDKAQTALDAHGVMGTAVACDLSEPGSVRVAVETVRSLGRKLAGIIANAGIMALPEPRTTLGLDLQFLTNHIGHFILVNGLADLLTDDGRVVVVSSGAHFMAPEPGIEFDNLSGQRDYQVWRTYGQSKLANLLMAKSLARTVGPVYRPVPRCCPPDRASTQASMPTGPAGRVASARGWSS